MAFQQQSRVNPGTRSTDREAQIHGCLTRWQHAMEHQDGEAAAECYTPDAVIFSLAPPLRESIDSYALQEWLDTWQDGPRYEMREVQLVAGDDVAYCRSLTHMSGTKVDGERVNLWFRTTVCLRQLAGEWRIAHEHTSVPFLMDGSDKAALDLRPQDH